MREGEVEETFFPRNPLDVLAQQIVAIAVAWRARRRRRPLRARPPRRAVRRARRGAVRGRARHALGPLSVGRVRRAAAAHRLGPRCAGTSRAREGAQRVAVVNAGTIPDRGLYGVFLAERRGRRPARRRARRGDGLREPRGRGLPARRLVLADRRDHPRSRPRAARAGRAGQDAVLARRPRRRGRSSSAARSASCARARWRCARERGDRAARSASTASTRAPREPASPYLDEQREATGAVPERPHDRRRADLDEVGDWRVCVLSPVRRPGPRAVGDGARGAAARSAASAELETLWSDDGIVFRLPEREEPPDAADLLPAPDEVEDLVARDLGGTSLFAARFRENAARALLLPRRHPGRRTPAVGAAQARAGPAAVAVALRVVPDPARDVPRVPAGRLRPARPGRARSRACARRRSGSSPWTPGALAVRGVAALLLRRELHLRRRRAARRAAGPGALGRPGAAAGAPRRGGAARALDARALDELELKLQRARGPRRGRRTPTASTTCCFARRPDRGRDPARARAAGRRRRERRAAWLDGARRASGGRSRSRSPASGASRRPRTPAGCATRSASRRPPGLPAAFLEPRPHPLRDSSRATPARTVRSARGRARASGSRGGRPSRRSPAGARRPRPRGGVPSGRPRPGVVRRRRAHDAAAPVARRAAPRGRAGRARGAGAPARRVAGRRPAARAAGSTRSSTWSSSCRGWRCPPRSSSGTSCRRGCRGYRPEDLDTLCAAGEVVWVGPGRARRARRPAGALPGRDRAATCCRRGPSRRRASSATGSARFSAARRALLLGSSPPPGAGSPSVVDALWDLVWAGEVTNDTLAPLRAFLARRASRAERRSASRASARAGRCRLGRGPLEPAGAAAPRPEPDRAAEGARRALLAPRRPDPRSGGAEEVPGGFSAVYPVLKAMEEAGRIRRGYFVAGLGGLQFADAGRARPAARAARRRPRGAPGAGSRRGRSGEPVRRGAAWPKLAEPVADGEEAGPGHASRERRACTSCWWTEASRRS